MKDRITVDGEEYILGSKVKRNEDGPIRIVVLQRGWCVVGRFERNGSDCKLKDASVIRSWGTTHGLGEIAANGPTASTKLDKCNGLVEFDYLTIVASIVCEESKWTDKL